MKQSARLEEKRNRRKGQAMSEYLILVALIAVGSIAVIQVLSRNLHGKLAQVANALGGHGGDKVDGIKAGAEVYKVRDLGDFGDGIQNNNRDR